MRYPVGSSNDPGSITSTIRIKLANGDNAIIGRSGYNLGITNTIAAKHYPYACTGGVSGNGVSLTGTQYTCAYLLTPTADVLDANGNQVRIQVVPPPAFTNPDQVNFNALGPPNQEFTITATNDATVTVNSADLPRGVGFTWTPAIHQAKLIYTPPSAPPPKHGRSL